MKRAACAITIALLAGAAWADVRLRGGGTVEAPVLAVTEAGVRVGGDAPRTLSWDLVRSIEGEFESAAEVFAELSTDLWRARTRLARGDYPLAAPIFEDLFRRYRDVDGPTTTVVALGALR